MNDPNSPFSSPPPFSSAPPIPTPDGNFTPWQPENNVVRGDWKSAPDIVRRGTYILTWISIVLSPVLAVMSIFNNKAELAQIIGLFLLFTFVFFLSVWMNRAFKKGTPAAWTIQIILSIIGLTGFPIGTIIHAYILYYWFKPETKAWFGKN